MRDYYDQTSTEPQLTRDDLANMRPQDIVKARNEGRLRDITNPERRDPPQGKDHQ